MYFQCFNNIFNCLITIIVTNKIKYESEFSNEKNRVDRRVQYHKLRSRQTFVEAMTSYLDWITQAGYLLK